MGNKHPGIDATAALGWRCQAHFRHGFAFDLAEVHALAQAQAQFFDLCFQVAVTFQVSKRFIAAEAELRCIEHSYGHAAIDAGQRVAIHFIDVVAGWKQSATG